MNEPERGVVEVGDTIQNCHELLLSVGCVQKGSFGVLLYGRFVETGNNWQGFMPSELPPQEYTPNWHGWASRGFLVLQGGMKVGSVSHWAKRINGGRAFEGMATLATCEALWLKTLDEWQPEAMQSKPLPVGENVTRMG